MDDTKAAMEYFQTEIAHCEKESCNLRQDERADEANLMKVRANIYDIYKTMYECAVRKNGEDKEAVKQYFLQKIEVIPRGWKQSYEAAKLHDDSEKILLESIKIATVEKIKAAIVQIWEEEK